MKIKATKTVVRFLNKNKLSDQYSFHFVELPEHYYSRLCVDVFSSIFDHEDDFNFETGLFNTIKVVYDPECYAMDRYITTKELNSWCNRLKDITVDTFINAVHDHVAV